MKAHYLKTVQPYFSEVEKGNKKFEVRENDRNFQVGDEVYLQEYDAETKTFSGKEIRATITYLLDEFELIYLGACVFSFKVTQHIVKNVNLETSGSNDC